MLMNITTSWLPFGGICVDGPYMAYESKDDTIYSEKYDLETANANILFEMVLLEKPLSKNYTYLAVHYKVYLGCSMFTYAKLHKSHKE